MRFLADKKAGMEGNRFGNGCQTQDCNQGLKQKIFKPGQCGPIDQFAATVPEMPPHGKGKDHEEDKLMLGFFRPRNFLFLYVLPNTLMISLIHDRWIPFNSWYHSKTMFIGIGAKQKGEAKTASVLYLCYNQQNQCLRFILQGRSLTCPHPTFCTVGAGVVQLMFLAPSIQND